MASQDSKPELLTNHAEAKSDPGNEAVTNKRNFQELAPATGNHCVFERVASGFTRQNSAGFRKSGRFLAALLSPTPKRLRNPWSYRRLSPPSHPEHPQHPNPQQTDHHQSGRRNR